MEKEKRNARNKQKMFRSIFAILFRFVLVLSFSFFPLFWLLLELVPRHARIAGICRDLQGYAGIFMHTIA